MPFSISLAQQVLKRVFYTTDIVNVCTFKIYLNLFVPILIWA